MDKIIVLVDKYTGVYKYYLGQPTEFKPKSFPGYKYHGSFVSIPKAQASARIHLAFSR